MKTKQDTTPQGQVPEALRLADALASNYFDGKQGRKVWDAAAAELRSLHAQVAALTAAPNAKASIHALSQINAAQRELLDAMGAPTAQAAPAAGAVAMISMVDAAMVEMKNITPPLRRSECERLIRAALAAANAPAAQADSGVQEDAARLDFIEKHPDMRFRHRKGRWAFGGFTNYEYDMLPSLREAIDVARAQQKGGL